MAFFLHAGELPKVLFFANPMQSDNDVIRRNQPGELSVAERHFAELSKEILELTITQDGHEITAPKLAAYDAVVFFTAINPPGVDLNALLDWVRNGGAFVGIHSTANTYQNHPGFGEMLGGRYERRPWRTREHPQTPVRIIVQDRDHPATRHLPQQFQIADDIYQFKDLKVDRIQILLRLDPSSLDLTVPGYNRDDQLLPVSWIQSYGKGRVFYTALGDWEQTWKDPRFRSHLLEGLRWTINGKPESPTK